MTDFKFISTPPAVGRWRLGGPQGLSLYMMRKPRWLTRVMCKWLLEWEWIDG